ncbi:MAG: hypothetical protein ACI35O_01220 [Bacillaceae bacterium]
MAFIKRKIKSKKDIQYLLKNATEFMKYDENGAKYYLFFPMMDKEINEQLTCTLMHYEDGQWTIHRKGNEYMDKSELQMTENDVVSILWDNRKEVNKML